MKSVFVGLAVAAVAGGGIAWAAIPDSGGTIHGCYQRESGLLRVVDTSASRRPFSSCTRNETALTWSQTGPQGPAGDAGPAGPAGPQGDPGPAWTPAYGIGSVLVSRVGAPATAWATYSTTLGSPVGDTTGGAFRFTCKAAQAPCALSTAASISGSATATVYPRVLIHKQEPSGGPSTYCEYADGADNDGNAEPVGSPLTMGIGGTLDCPGSTQAYPAGGVVTEIDVPAGYYDVWATFVFKTS